MNGHMAVDPAIRQPKIEMRKLEEDYAEFVLSSTDASMANALRRIMIAEVRAGDANSTAYCSCVKHSCDILAAACLR